MINIYIFEYKIILTKLFYILLLGLCALRTRTHVGRLEATALSS